MFTLPFDPPPPKWVERDPNSNGIGMTGQRPHRLEAPAYLSESPPVPAPAEAQPIEESGGLKGKEPTRYGDWENKGICRDF